MGKKILKRIVRNLPCTKDNEINVFHSDVKIHAPYTGPHKRFLIYYGLCLEAARNVFYIMFYDLLLSY